VEFIGAASKLSGQHFQKGQVGRDEGERLLLSLSKSMTVPAPGWKPEGYKPVRSGGEDKDQPGNRAPQPADPTKLGYVGSNGRRFILRARAVARHRVSECDESEVGGRLVPAGGCRQIP